MTKTFKTEALVLRKRSLINKDSLVTLFTKELGKINVFAKGIKKITSRRLPHTQSANLVNILISKKGDWLYLQESSLISGFSQIKRDHKKIRHLYLCLFVLERLLPENQSEEKIYNLTKKFLIDLSSGSDPGNQSEQFINKALIVLGYSKEKKSLGELKEEIEGIIDEKIPALDF